MNLTKLIFFVLFAIFCSQCGTEKSRTAETLGNLEKAVLVIYPPVLPPDQLCVTQKYEISPQILKHSFSRGLCGDSISTTSEQQKKIDSAIFTQIKVLLQNIKADKFSNDSKYDGNYAISLQIDWANTKESFSFMHYEGKEMEELYKLLAELLPLPEKTQVTN